MKNFYSIVSLLIFVLLSSCHGDDQNKLVGNWEQIPFTDPADSIATPVKTFWQFTGGDALNIFHVSGETMDSLVYRYTISGTVLDVLSGDDAPGYAPAAGDPRGQYWVDHLSKEQLKMTKRKHPPEIVTTESPYLRIELVKR